MNNAQDVKTDVSVWIANGTPTSANDVTATFSDAPSGAAIIVSRYTGVDGKSCRQHDNRKHQRHRRQLQWRNRQQQLQFSDVRQ
ncbi:MAG: hypothetical protein R3C26_05855 [Calditrichia bacterium]